MSNKLYETAYRDSQALMCLSSKKIPTSLQAVCISRLGAHPKARTVILMHFLLSQDPTEGCAEDGPLGHYRELEQSFSRH